MKFQTIYLFTFLLALFVRFSMIHFTPKGDKLTDLLIYREAGQLVVNGINPYDYSDQKELRNYLRTDSTSYNEYTSKDQDTWNYFAGGNLPLATLFFGGIEYFFPFSIAYRYIFAFFDSLLAVLVVAIVLKKIKLSPSATINEYIPNILQQYSPLIIGLALSAISPVFLLNGTINSEHKGIGLLFILSALYFSDNPRKIYSILLSSILLGASISFIGLGIFIIPVCFFNIYNHFSFKHMLLYGFTVFASAIVWIIPFVPELIAMMISRINAATTIPNHGSMYVIFYNLMPLNSVNYLKNVFTFLFAIISIVGVIKKRLNMEILSASLIYIFTCIYIVSGNMDRMNIAIVTVIILLIYSEFYRMTYLLTALYFLHGSFTLLYTYVYKHIRFEFDGYFILIFSFFFFLFLVNQTFNFSKSE